VNDTERRVAREQEIYDSGKVKEGQQKLGAILSHLNDGPARHRRDKTISDVVRARLDGEILEIGSQAWAGVYCRERMQPQNLICINISERELENGRTQAKARNFKAQFRLMDAHELAFPDAQFNMVYGFAILHHLDFERAIKEFWRVLKPSGTIVFVEPLILNPVAIAVRALTPWARTIDEKPLGPNELRFVDRYFETRSLYTDLLTVPASLISRLLFARPDNFLMRLADNIDQKILGWLPSSGAIYRTVTLIGQKRETPLVTD
jgi:SAM-dependent methyltransferase